MFPRRKRRGKLQKQNAQLSSITNNRHRAEKEFDQCFLQIRCRFHFALRVRLCALLQIRRQQLRRCRVKRKQLMQLYIEREMIRRRCTPALCQSRFRHGIKRRVYLHQVEMLCVPSEPLACRHLLRIPALNKTRVRPACCADKNFPVHTSTKSPRRRKQT